MVDALGWINWAVWLVAGLLAVRNVWLRYRYAEERRTAARVDHDEWLTTHRKTWNDPLPPVFDRPWAAPHLKRIDEVTEA